MVIKLCLNYRLKLFSRNIDYVDGVNYYVDYCRKNGITKEYLDKAINQNTPDIMKKFEKNIEM